MKFDFGPQIEHMGKS